jgi:hypothetical protein
MKTNIDILNSLYSMTGKSFIIRKMQYITLATILFMAGSCSKSDSNPEVVFKATINGESETPPNASTATGTATLTFNQDTKMFTIVVNYTGIVATNAHIHKGAVGVPGGVIFGFTTPFTSPINYTSAVLDSTQIADLNLDLYYVNIHSEAYPGGEIRGQLIKQ